MNFYRDRRRRLIPCVSNKVSVNGVECKWHHHVCARETDSDVAFSCFIGGFRIRIKYRIGFKLQLSI